MASTPPTSHRFFLKLGLCLLLFIVYGSLVPLDYHPKGASVAWQEFLRTRYYDLDLASRADWVANLLLYIPLGFFLTAALRGAGDRAGGVLPVVVVFLICITVAVAIEFTQIFFPPRSVSLNDLVAELMGTLTGIALWLAAGTRLVRLAGAVTHGGPLAIRAVVTVYALGYLALSLFPYDFVVNAAEFEWKLRNGMYGLFIVTGACGGVLACSVKLTAEITAAAPLGVLMGMLLTRRSSGAYARALLAGCALGAVIELAQFLIASGISQGVSVLTRGAGLALGVAVHRVAGVVRLDSIRGLLRPAVLLGAVPYAILLMAVNGWFSAPWADVESAMRKLAEAYFVPFYYHYYTSESVALRSLLNIAAAYLPVGIGCWMWSLGTSRPRPVRPWVAAILAAALAFVIEAGKLFVPGKKPDPTDLLIAAAAAYAVYAFAAAIHRWSAEQPRAAHGVSQPPRERAGAGPLDAAGLTARVLSILLLIAVAIFLLLYPYGAALAVFLGAYAAMLWRWPQAAIPAVLALLPVLDFAPWTGWFFFDEFDALLLVTVAVMSWRLPPGVWSLRKAGLPGWVVALLVVSYSVSAAIGMIPLHPLDANSFSSYFSHYNSLRTLKGFAWAFVLAAPAIHQLRQGVAGQKQLVAGMVVGLTAVSLAALWERHLFGSILDFSTDYRITSTFSSMHTGGAFVEGYLVLAIPFLALWAYLRRGAAAYGAALILFILASYALMVTFSRGGYLGYGVALAFLGIGALAYARRNRIRRYVPALMAAAMLTMACAIAYPVLEGTFMQSRFAAVGRDVGIRSTHWRHVLSTMDDGWLTAAFGMGLGRFPEAYFYRNPAGKSLATYSYARDKANVYLILGGGDLFYFGQRVAIERDSAYVLEFDLRSRSAGAELAIALCEKSILYSYDCIWLAARSKAVNKWERQRITVNSGSIGLGLRHAGRPVELAFTVSKSGTRADVDNVKLLDARGRDVVRNGDFSQGNSYWFFSGDDHLQWHAKNLALQILFEQGAFGLFAFVLVFGYGAARLARALPLGDPFPGVLLASLMGFVLVGLFDSLFDAPRIAMLFFLWLFVAIAAPWLEATRSRSSAQTGRGGGEGRGEAHRAA